MVSKQEQFRNDWKKPVVLVATGFGSGFTPVMPGTVTSLLAMLYWWYFVADFGWLFQFALVVGTYAIAFVTVRYVQDRYEIEDFPSITVDELVGQWCALFMLPSDFLPMVLGFIMFRAFDIFKPLFIGKVEKLNGAHGVLLDDVLAGAVTCVLVHLMLYVGESIGVPLSHP